MCMCMCMCVCLTLSSGRQSSSYQGKEARQVFASPALLGLTGAREGVPLAASLPLPDAREGVPLAVSLSPVQFIIGPSGHHWSAK